MLSRVLFSAIGLVMLLSFAQSPALARSKPSQEELNALQSKIEVERQREEKLKQQASSAEAEREQSRKTLVKLGKDLQANEQTLTDLEKKTAKLNEEMKVLAVRLEKDYGSMGDLILALQRMRRMPPETLIIRPGAPVDMAQSALLLQSILPAVNARATSLNNDLKRLKDIQKMLDDDKTRTLALTDKLKLQKNEMQAMLDKREKLYRRSRTAYETQAESVAQMAAEAKSLQQLMTRLDREEDDQPYAGRAKKVAMKLPSLPGGAWQAPVSGEIVIGFGERDDIGAESSGIRIASRPGALVTAPVGGVVRFAGPFRNYGNMVIIEHDKGYHSLLGGLSRIDISVGRKITAGEPLGSMSGTGNGASPKLYYELRHNGKPVDPAAKFPSLS